MSDPVARLNAALEGRYAIERELGEGGMATVYLAKDLKHNGFYPARADTSEKAHLGPGGVSWQSEGSTARSLNVRRSG